MASKRTSDNSSDNMSDKTADGFDDPQDAAQIRALSYEDAREELIAVVAKLESGQLPLADSMALWRRGEALAAQCTALLDAAQEQLDAAAEQVEPAGERAGERTAGGENSAGGGDPL